MGLPPACAGSNHCLWRLKWHSLVTNPADLAVGLVFDAETHLHRYLIMADFTVDNVTANFGGLKPI